jgi:hypothetical protein
VQVEPPVERIRGRENHEPSGEKAEGHTAAANAGKEADGHGHQHQIGDRIGQRCDPDRQPERALGVGLHQEDPRKDGGSDSDDEAVDHGGTIPPAASPDDEGEANDHERDPTEVEGIGDTREFVHVADVAAPVEEEVTGGVRGLAGRHQPPWQGGVGSPASNSEHHGDHGRRIQADVEREARCPVGQSRSLRVGEVDEHRQRAHGGVAPAGAGARFRSSRHHP